MIEVMLDNQSTPTVTRLNNILLLTAEKILIMHFSTLVSLYACSMVYVQL